MKRDKIERRLYSGRFRQRNDNESFCGELMSVGRSDSKTFIVICVAHMYLEFVYILIFFLKKKKKKMNVSPPLRM